MAGKTFGGELSNDNGKFTIIHKLNAQAGKWNLDAKWFEPNLKDWENIPVIFAKDHPTVLARTDLKGALDSCNGKLMGFPSNIRIEKTGHPKLVGNIPINDAVAQSYYDRGLLTPSAAWDSPDDGSNITGPVVPDHILLFPEDDAHRPGDRAAMMFQAPIPEQWTEIKSFLGQIWDKVKGNKEKGGMEMNEGEIKAFKDEMEKKLAESDTKLKTFEAENAKLRKDLEEAQKALKEFQQKAEQEKADNRWKLFQSEMRVPKGWLTGKVKVGDKEEDRAAVTRKEFEADPAAFAIRLNKFNDQNQDLGKEADGKDDAAGGDQGGREFPAVKTIGSPLDWDEKEGVYK